MASSLVWGLTRDTNSFLYRRNRTSRNGQVQLSAEKGNLLAAKTAKYSGFANDAAIDLSQGVNSKGNKCVVLSKKTPKAAKKGSDNEVTTVYTMKQLEKALKGYRGDLGSAAKAKFVKLARGASNANGFTKGAKKSSNRSGKKAEFTFTKLQSFRKHIRNQEE